MSEPVTETELRALGSLRRQCLFAVTILLVEDSRSASEAIRLFAAESGARVRRADSLHAASRHLAIYRPNVVMVDLGLPDGDGMALIRHLAARLDPDRRHRGAQRPRARRLAGRGDRRRRRGLPREADREPARLPGMRARACCPTPTPGAGPTSARWRSPAAPRCRRRSTRTCAGRGALLAEAMPAGDGETVAYCAQFLGSVGEMLGDRDLRAAARVAGDPGGALLLAGLLDRRLGAGRQVA